jgi:mannose-6-phosphate isomerase-like protein (cupin superfamily)
MLRILAVLLLLAQAGATRSLPAVDVKMADIQAAVKQEIATKTTDIQIRMVDTGTQNIGIAVVHREKGSGPNNAAIHDKVSEVYQVTEGGGTFVTGGELVSPQRRDNSSETVVQLSGPGIGGTGIKGGVTRRLVKGDIVVIPAGTPHWFSEIPDSITYTIVRVDPARVVKLK